MSDAKKLLQMFSLTEKKKQKLTPWTQNLRRQQR
jgi:hypothetical protein